MMRFLWLLFVCLPVVAEDVILVGSGGNPEYRQRFGDWANRLERILVEDMGRSKEDVHLLKATDNGSKVESIEKLFESLAKTHKKTDVLFVYLIGHGSYLRGVSKFQVPGKDLETKRLGELMDKVPSRYQVVIASGSTSAPFVNVLSREDRVVTAATKSATEQNATEYMALFLQALEEGLADQDRDERISVWEASRQAASLTESWYGTNGLIATEHSILDDNGDGLGTRLFNADYYDSEKKVEADEDGDLAREIFIKDFQFPANVPQVLIDEYLGLVAKARLLKKRKSKMGETAYWNELERVMLQAAQKNKQIREMGTRQD